MQIKNYNTCIINGSNCIKENAIEEILKDMVEDINHLSKGNISLESY